MKKKKIATILLSLTMMASVMAVPQSVHAADEITLTVGSGVTATISEDRSTLTFSGNGAIQGAVVESGPFDYSIREQITTVVFEEGITAINCNTLQDLPNITGTLTLPSTLTTIGERAFYNAGFTGTLVIPDNVQTIGNDAFKGLSGINRIEIGSGVTNIGSDAFWVSSYVETEIVTENEVALAYNWVQSNRELGAGSGSSIQVQDGAGTGTTTMNGKVSTITQIDVTVPIGGINFIIDEDGQIHAQGIVIESNTAIPLSVNMVSVSPLAAGDETDGLGATTHKAPELVLANKYTADEWNNLTKAQTEAEIAISLKQVDITPEGEAGAELTEATTDALKVSTPVELGDLSVKKSLAHLESGYGTPAKCAINLETSQDFTNYGKAWLSASDITFRYLTTLEFAFDNM